MATAFPVSSVSSRRPWSVWVVFSLLVFLSLNAVLPGWAMIADPSGAALSFPPGMLRNPIFPNYLIPGLFLFGVVGIGSMVVAILFLLKANWAWAQSLNPIRRMHWSWTLTLAMGTVVMLWIVIQYFSITMISWLQPFVFALGLAIVLLLQEPRLRRYYAAAIQQSAPEPSSR